MPLRLLQRDTSCPNGGVYYNCNAGFVGCCLVEACNPGVGCPQDKDRTPDEVLDAEPSTTTRASTASTKEPSAQTSASTPSILTFMTSMNPSSVRTTMVASSHASLSLVQASSIVSPAPAATLEGKQQPPKSAAVPTAAIVGGVLGTIILIAILVGIFLCILRRQRTKVYKAASYPSPYVGSDMSPQLPEHEETLVSKFAGTLGITQRRPQQIDSREVLPAAEMGETPPRHMLYAELPAS